MKPQNRAWTAPPVCPHGERSDRATKDGMPLCPFCRRALQARRAAQAAQTTETIGWTAGTSAPVLDHATAAAHDDTLFDEDQP